MTKKIAVHLFGKFYASCAIASPQKFAENRERLGLDGPREVVGSFDRLGRKKLQDLGSARNSGHRGFAEKSAKGGWMNKPLNLVANGLSRCPGACAIKLYSCLVTENE